METVSHVSDVAQPELIAVASGHAEAGQPFDITLTAYAVGREDAQHDEPFCPEMIFIKPFDLYDYSIGFLSIRPDCLPALAMAEAFEQAQYELAHGEEPAWVPTLLDFDVEF